MAEKSIFITGAGSGIGKETARVFAERGWRVGLGDRDAGSVERLAREIGAAASPYEADVLDAAALVRAIEAFSGAGGVLDALFGSAGVLDMRRHRDIPLSRQHEIVDINIKGVLNAIDAALPALRRRGDAHIVTMSSAAAIHGVPDQAVYAASKFFVRGLTEGLNIELQPEGIWVSDVMVGYVDTPMVRDADTISQSVEVHGIHATARQVAETVFAAIGGRQVHWFVSKRESGYARHLDSLAWNQRDHVARSGTRY